MPRQNSVVNPVRTSINPPLQGGDRQDVKLNPNVLQFVPSSAAPGVELFSKHLLQQEIIKKGIKKFDGKAYEFWSFIGKLQHYIKNLQLTPLETLQLLESHTTGGPNELICNSLAAAGEITEEILQDVWGNLVMRYGASKKIAEQLLEKLDVFPAIHGSNPDEQLHKLYDLCKIVEYNLPRCQELQIVNLSTGLRHARQKLPDFIQLFEQLL